MRENKVLRAILLLRTPIKRGILLFVAVIMFATWFLPFLVPEAEAAAQITSRSVTIASAVPNKTSVVYTFNFTTATSAFHLDGIKLIACTTAIGTYPGGTCTAPTAFSFASSTLGTMTGFDSAAWSVDTTGANDCIATAHPEVLCIKHNSVGNDTASAKVVTVNAVHNPTIPSGNGFSYYIGITTYNAQTWPSGAGRIDAGTVATAVVQTLTVNAQVAEVLNFCVGSTAVNDATTSVAGDCSAVSGTSINLGTLDSGTVSISPVTTNGGDSNNAVAMLRTNAANGATVAYDAIQASGTNHVGTLRLSGVTCNVGSINTDGCINSVGTTQTAFTAGTEAFGMTVAGVNCGSTSASSYSCVYASGTNNLKQVTNYIGGTSNVLYGSTAAKGYAWQESGAAVTIGDSTSSSIKQVDDEALILSFAATPSITTPFGAYSVQVDYIAAPSF